jgi:uncharacterized protein
MAEMECFAEGKISPVSGLLLTAGTPVLNTMRFRQSPENPNATPHPEFGFPGLKPGDRWCLCATRWQEAFEASQAPRVVLRATHEAALAYCSLADLKRLAVDLA